MNDRIDPKDFGLPPRTVLQQVGKDRIALVMDRKSRLIMADGRKIIDKFQKITTTNPSLRVIVKTNAPICSKTATFLEAEGIEVSPL